MRKEWDLLAQLIDTMVFQTVIHTGGSFILPHQRTMIFEVIFCIFPLTFLRLDRL